jgi:hypothetical protein
MTLLRLHRMRLTTTPAIPSGWTLPSCGTVPPTGCPRHHGSLHQLPPLLPSAERQWFGLHYSRRPPPAPTPLPPTPTPLAPAPAPAPRPVSPAAEPPARVTRSTTGSLPPPMQWLVDDNIQPGLSASRHHSCCTCRCPLAHNYGRRVQGPD